MLDNVTLRNFKCFEEVSIELRPFTLLAGINGSGKSSVIQAMLLLGQSVLPSDRLGTQLDIQGDFVELGTGRDILYNEAKEDRISFIFEYTDAEKEEYIFAYDSSTETLNAFADEQQTAPPHFFSNQFIYLCAERLGPRKMLPLAESSVRDRKLGKSGELVFHYLSKYGAELLSADDPRLLDPQASSLVRASGEWLRLISPGIHLELDILRAVDASVGRYSFDREGDVPSGNFRPTNVGFGISYVLPIIVALLTAKHGSLVIIENPEAHLHPSGQSRIAELAIRACAAGVQVVMETHSDHIMNGARLAVRKSGIEPEKCAFQFFRREAGASYVTRPTIDDAGRLSEWPTGFFDEAQRLLFELTAPQ